MSDRSAGASIRMGWFIDGQGGPMHRDVVMTVREDRIFSIRPADAESIVDRDLTEATVLPMLMDAHVHLTLSGTLDARARAEQLNPSPEQARTRIARHLRDHWKCGVAAVRDGGDRGGCLLDCKKNGLLALAPPLTVACPGWAWHAPGRYGTMIGRTPPEGKTLVEAIAGHLDCIDHLKLLQSGLNSIDRFGHCGGPQFSDQDLQAAVRAARVAGKPVMVHANGARAVRMALDAGCDSIEHGYFMGPDNLRRMVDKGIAWVPTAIPMAALARSPELNASQHDTARRTLADQLEQIRMAHDLGVTIALGTDAGGQGVDHGHAVRREIRLFMAAGMRLEEAIGCAAINTARLMRLDGRGALIPGYSADFIVVSGPPDDLPESLESIQAICMAGTWFELRKTPTTQSSEAVEPASVPGAAARNQPDRR